MRLHFRAQIDLPKTHGSPKSGKPGVKPPPDIPIVPDYDPGPPGDEMRREVWLTLKALRDNIISNQNPDTEGFVERIMTAHSDDIAGRVNSLKTRLRGETALVAVFALTFFAGWFATVATRPHQPVKAVVVRVTPTVVVRMVEVTPVPRYVVSGSGDAAWASLYANQAVTDAKDDTGKAKVLADAASGVLSRIKHPDAAVADYRAAVQLFDTALNDQNNGQDHSGELDGSLQQLAIATKRLSQDMQGKDQTCKTSCSK